MVSTTRLLVFGTALLAAQVSTHDYTREDNTLLPSFITTGQTYRIVTGDTVVLPCEANNLGGFQLVWKRGIAVLTAGSMIITPDSRFRLIDGFNLEVSSVQPQDGGDYVCQIATMEPQEIVHTVEILVPPQFRKVSSNGFMTVKKGSPFSLECRASGNPVPTITWGRKNNLLPSGEKTVEGISIKIEQANRHHAGVYQCTASNGVGVPITKDITLQVLHAPEIEVERSWVHSGEGNEAQLVCIVHAEPAADVLWYRDTLILDTTERRITEVRGSRHTLIIRKVRSEDFGNYSCAADNSLGRTRQYVQLSGNPNPAVFQSDPVGRYRDRYNITWTVDSYTPVEEFKLSFRKMPDNDTYMHTYSRGDWNELILASRPTSSFTHGMWYNMERLEPASVYECKVQAKNRFGWSKESEKFQFYTRGSENSLFEPSPEPAVFAESGIRDLGMTAPAGVSVGSSAYQMASFLILTLEAVVCPLIIMVW